MSDIKLFRISADGAEELASGSVGVEKSLQTLIERHLDRFLGIRFLASEYATGKTHGGRIDTLGIDENNCPVIIEYKRALNENVINQGLFYLNWLMDHKAEFKLLVLERFGKEHADGVDWSAPRLLCIAGDFTKYDEHAVREIPRAVELIRYRRYGDDLVLFELVTATGEDGAQRGKSTYSSKPPSAPVGRADGPKVRQRLEQSSAVLRDRFDLLRAFLLALGDDVQERTLNDYIAYRRLRNFATVQFQTQKDCMLVFVNVDPDGIVLEPGFTRDRRTKGQIGVWSLEITVDDDADLERARPLLIRSYEAS